MLVACEYTSQAVKPNSENMQVNASQPAAPDRGTRPIRRAAMGMAFFLATPSLHIGALPISAAQLPSPAPQANETAPPPASGGFTEATVQMMARQLSTTPFRQPAPVTPGLAEMTYDQYRQIQVRYENSIWAKEKLPFLLDLLPAGFVYKSAVQVSTVDAGKVTPLTGAPAMFRHGAGVPANLRNVPLSLSGFRVRAPINSRDVATEFIVFQGASYFRAVGQGQVYGLSARGLALRTGEAGGEEFPAFTHFWIEKPTLRATSIVIHALLDSPSTTGAYRFEVTPGRQTQVDVRFTLYPRVDLKGVGIAPLTSMFLFDGTNHARFDDFRNRVHDSDGLLFEQRNGERAWRQLANPRSLQISAFTSTAPRNFGLVQRARLLSDYQDLEASYERRPTAWVDMPENDAAGELVLVEIPTRYETNDNIVAFWRPRDVMPAGRPYEGSYTLHWTAEALLPSKVARFTAARNGLSMDGQRRLFLLDVSGAGSEREDAAAMTLDVTTSAGIVLHKVVQPNPAIRGLRASFELDAKGADLAEIRAVLRRKGQAISETWLYRWTAD
jgi:periplasmic glucans biosynthesis protein